MSGFGTYTWSSGSVYARCLYNKVFTFYFVVLLLLVVLVLVLVVRIDVSQIKAFLVNLTPPSTF
jgi:hypothetical protein